MKKLLYLLLAAIIISSCGSGNSSSKEAETFDTFIEQFHSDKDFQMSRIQFPLKGTYSDFDGSIEWSKNSWDFIPQSVHAADTEYYEIKDDRKEYEVMQGVYCKGCGFSYELKFELIDKEWFLVYRQENNF
jgi:hypothetical protein